MCPPLPHNCVIRHSRTRRKNNTTNKRNIPKARVGGLLCVSRALVLEWRREREPLDRENARASTDRATR